MKTQNIKKKGENKTETFVCSVARCSVLRETLKVSETGKINARNAKSYAER